MLSRTTCAALLATLSMAAHALIPGSGTWVKETATYGTPNLQNAYVYVPKNAAPEAKNNKRALMLTLHGCSMTANTVINAGFNWEATAEKYGMVVVAPTAPTRLANCWDWTGSNFSRTTRDAVPLKKLVESIRSRPELDIDIDQIYVTGFSSGGVQAAVMSCAFPELFAGAGIASAPVLGSKDANLVVTPEQMATYCKAANGNAYNDAFATQIASLVHGTADTNVPATHTTRSQQGRALLYGNMNLNSCGAVSAPSGTSISECPDAAGHIRLSKIIIDGLRHEWPAGGGTAPTGVSRNTINYPASVTAWLFKNNLRANSYCVSMLYPAPQVVEKTADSVKLSWQAVSNATYTLYRNNVQVATLTGNTATDSGLKPATTYTYHVRIQSGGCTNQTQTISVTTAGMPAVTQLTATPYVYDVDLRWAAVEGAVSYRVSRNGVVIASVSTNSYRDSGLNAGTAYRYCVSAVNQAGEISQDSCIEVTTSTPQCWRESYTGTCATHYMTKHLSYNQYRACLAKHGYTQQVVLFAFGTPTQWSNYSDCRPMAF